jgi:arylsulfatase A-like enzyme
MFDSLARHTLQPYGCEWTNTPNFTRLARHAITFDQSYICSMPCMPARRDFITGRPNFLHRSWGPVEPFDDSVPDMLREKGVHSHLATDHQHYWEDGGCTYHTRYNTYDLVRGQEGDPWIGRVNAGELPPREIPRHEQMVRQDYINREVTSAPERFPLNVTFDNGLEFLRRNLNADNWLLQIETFDPHEPFFLPAEDGHRAAYAGHFDNYDGKPVEWPPYRSVREPESVVAHARYEYAALLSACDSKLGKILDFFDQHDLWKDTMLIVWTDHGFMLGEHGCWGKCWMPFYEEIARTPFFAWDPRFPDSAGQRRQALVQPAIDLGPTLLKFFGAEPTCDMTGHDLAPVMESGGMVREHAIFGMFGGHVNITDGRFVYMRGPAHPENQPLFEYTLMPTRMRRRFHPEELSGGVTLAPPFSFTKNCPVLKVPVKYSMPGGENISLPLPTYLFDLYSDAAQQSAARAPEVERDMIEALIVEMRKCGAPEEQFARLGLTQSPLDKTPAACDMTGGCPVETECL